MPARLALLFTVVALPATAVTASQAADCVCRAQGREFELGQTVCLASPKGPRIATCGMVLNNTSWQFSDTPCVISAAPVRETPYRAANALLTR
jgi:hypothetical protein